MDKNRLMYIDNIRLLVIILVVVQHISVTYSGFGDWYYIEPGKIGIVQTALFGIWQATVQGFSMGLLFLIAGYFLPGAYDKKGFGRFINDRLIRLGAPTIIYMLVIHPLLALGILGYRFDAGGFIAHGDGSLLIAHKEYLVGFHFIGGSGPLWFALTLLIFTIIYALIRKFTATKAATATGNTFPTFLQISALILLISVCAFLVRIVQPIGTNILNIQLSNFSSYVILFIIGIKCKQNNWFEKLDYATVKPWLIRGIAFGIIMFAVIMISGGALAGDLTPFNGGVTWQSAAYSVWESYVAVAMSIALIAVFKAKYNIQSKLIKTMSTNAFSVYVFHAPVIVALSLLFASIHLVPIAKFVIIVLAGVPLCFLITNLTIQKIPFLRKLFA